MSKELQQQLVENSTKFPHCINNIITSFLSPTNNILYAIVWSTQDGSYLPNSSAQVLAISHKKKQLLKKLKSKLVEIFVEIANDYPEYDALNKAKKFIKDIDWNRNFKKSIVIDECEDDDDAKTLNIEFSINPTSFYFITSRVFVNNADNRNKFQGFKLDISKHK
jgi:hypothetical protein